MRNRFPNSIPFLMHVIVAKVVSEASQDFKEIGLSVQEARVLLATVYNPGIRVGQLAEITGIDGSTLSHMLRRMERSELITRERVESDNRSVVVELSAHGKRIARICQKATAAHEAALVRGIDKQRLDAFRSVLEDMFGNVEIDAPAYT